MGAREIAAKEKEGAGGRGGAFSTALRYSVVASAGLILGLSPLISGPFATSPILNPYLPTSAHKAYGFQLAQSGLAHSSVSRAWISRSERALFEPDAVEPPFETAGSFARAQPMALGYRFSGESGKRIEVTLALETASADSDVFIDLYRLAAGALEHVASAPPAPASGGPQRLKTIETELLQDGDYVVRVQPALETAGGYRLTIAAVPTLRFPVDGFDPTAIKSGFGADRDGGRRAHRGVDIFAPRGTPAVAAMDARVRRVQTTGRGGKVVWLQSLFSNLRLYYAHLDSQAVEPGQYVFAGETIGTVGNTGNARTTPPHLHFGVYVRRRGARDPDPFLQ